jgi:hypothetical protein
MTVAPRDSAIVQLVARFKQASSRQIHDALFYNVSSHTPSDRALKRLVDSGYLTRIERRLVGGTRGGSGQYCYALGRKGYFSYFDGRYSPARAINYHSLAILDTFLVFRRLERAGLLKLVGVSTEPDSWEEIGGVTLKPDLFIEASDHNGVNQLIWCEVDLATESQKQIRAKLETYQRAYDDADVTKWQRYPWIIWVAVDDERAKELRWIISRGPEAAQALFAVTTMEHLPELL